MHLFKRVATSSRSAKGAMIVSTAATLLFTMNTPAGAAPAAKQRVLADRNAGVQLTVSNEGDCNKVNVQTAILPTSKTDAVTEVVYDFDAKCNVTLRPTKLVDQTSFRKANGYGSTPAPLTRMATSTSEAGMLAAAAVNYGNYVHSSQTVQDVIAIDIARLQYHTDRNWNYSCSWWQPDRWAQSYSGVSWDHPETPTFGATGGTACNNAWTTTVASANFHSDWLWCNFTANWQKLSLTNTNYTRSDGTGGATWIQSRACPGTHMATRVWANTNRNG